MRRALLLAILVAVLLPIYASAQTPTVSPTVSPTVTPTASPTPPPTSPERYPTTLVDQDCQDYYNVPAAQTGGSVAPAAQTSGTGDDRCDHDSRIVTDAAFVAGTTFGPFKGGKSACYIIFADGNAVTGGDAGWGIVVQATQPHDGVKESLDAAAEVTGVVDAVWMVGLPTEYSYSALDEELNVRLPNRWYLVLDLLGATSWYGEISMVGC